MPETEIEVPIEWTELPEPEGGFTHDPMDMLSHTWYELEPWISLWGETGERRILACTGCPIPALIQMRAADPDDPLPEVGVPEGIWSDAEAQAAMEGEEVVIPEPDPVETLSEEELEAFMVIADAQVSVIEDSGEIEAPEPEDDMDALRAAQVAAFDPFPPEPLEVEDGPDAE